MWGLTTLAVGFFLSIFYACLCVLSAHVIHKIKSLDRGYFYYSFIIFYVFIIVGSIYEKFH